MKTVIDFVQSIAVFVVVMLFAYIGIVLILRTKVTDKKRFVLYKNLIGAAGVVLMGFFVFWRITHLHLHG